MDVPVLANKQRLTYINFVWTLDVVYKTYQDQWVIKGDGVFPARLDDDIFRDLNLHRSKGHNSVHIRE